MFADTISTKEMFELMDVKYINFDKTKVEDKYGFKGVKCIYFNIDYDKVIKDNNSVTKNTFDNILTLVAQNTWLGRAPCDRLIGKMIDKKIDYNEFYFVYDTSKKDKRAHEVKRKIEHDNTFVKTWFTSVDLSVTAFAYKSGRKLIDDISHIEDEIYFINDTTLQNTYMRFVADLQSQM